MGKTRVRQQRKSPLLKHPHVRGEDSKAQLFRASIRETPPRAWGRHTLARLYAMRNGNTPTCVGKTTALSTPRISRKKHPHVRGEDCASSSFLVKLVETPPRAWGRQPAHVAHGTGEGNTPTCVGKTTADDSERRTGRKHPHVRGEDLNLGVAGGQSIETPPRAWGRLLYVSNCALSTRNTPTCVGKTFPKISMAFTVKKHPHVRGEDSPLANASSEPIETPPRAWGRRVSSVWETSSPRNTPTCVGKTERKESSMKLFKKHPHVRGEDFT